MRRDELYSQILECGSDSLSRFGGVKEGGYRIQQNPLELSRFVEWGLRQKFNKYLEVGIGSFGLIRFLNDVGFANEYYSIDNDPKTEGMSNHYCGTTRDPQCVRFVGNLGILDLAFIDGSHRYEDAKHDFEVLLPRSRFIAFHDHLCVQDIRDLTRKLSSRYETVFETYDKSNPFGIIVYKIPALPEPMLWNLTPTLTDT